MKKEVHNGGVDLFMEQLWNWMWYGDDVGGGGVGDCWGFWVLLGFLSVLGFWCISLVISHV